MWLGIGWHAVRIMARRAEAAAAASYRKGYLIALAGLFLVLGTVHIWGAVSVFIMFYLGAGAWIYATEPEPEPEPAVRRPRTRAGAAGTETTTTTATPPAAGTPAGPRRGRGATTRQRLV